MSHHPDTLVVMDASAGAMMPVWRMGLEEKLADAVTEQPMVSVVSTNCHQAITFAPTDYPHAGQHQPP